MLGVHRAATERKKETKPLCPQRVKQRVKWTQSLKAAAEDPENPAVVMVTHSD